MAALRCYCLLLVFFVCRIPAGAQLVINELMQSNVDCIMDDLNEFPDSWVELCNVGTNEVNLGDYRLGITQNADEAWPLPERTLQPGDHVLVFCDKVGSNTDTGIHADFRLESGKGGAVFLFRGSDVADGVTELKKQPAPNIAYGRKTDCADEWGYMAEPTPGAPNCGKVYAKALTEPVFSIEGGVWHEGEEVKLKISAPPAAPAGTVVRFTRDGTEPTASCPRLPDGRAIFIRKNTVVRAKLFCEGYLPSRSIVQSYIFFPNDRPLTLPVISLVTDPRYLYDDKIGIYVEGSYNGEQYNYQYDWRRPVNFEFFEGMNQSSVLNQLVETRIGGGATRMNERKTLTVYAHKRFGEKRLKYEFFPDQRPGVKDFKSLMLRSAGNDFSYLYLRDALMQRVMASHTDLDWQAWRPAIVYINGEYTGMLNIRERTNEDNIYTHYEGLEDIDLIENRNELKQGTIDQSREFRRFFSQPGHSLEEYRQWMDCEEFANLMIMNLYFDNRDFPANNIVMWRPREEGGRWRWIAKDTDYGLGLFLRQAAFNTVAWINDYNYDTAAPRGNTPWHTLLFRNIMGDEGFRNLFTERAAIYMGDFLNSRGVHAVWDAMYEKIRTELPFHRACLTSYQANYEKEVQRVDAWLSQRTGLFYQYLQQYYHLEPLIPLVIDRYREDDAPAEIRFNGIRLSEGCFDGMFFRGREVTLQGSASDDEGVDGWKLTFESRPGEEWTEIVAGDICVFTVPECTRITVNPLIGSITGIAEVKTKSPVSDGWFTLDGRRLGGKPSRSGIYIRNGAKVFNHF
jgi:hypothetical protein